MERGLRPSAEARLSAVSDTLVQDRMALYSVPGMSVAIIDQGEIDWAAGYGVLEGGRTAAVDEHSLFQCCSTSKMVAALVVMALVDQRKLGLDDDVNRTLTTWKLRSPDGKEKQATVRQLLSHTGGVNVHGAPGYPRGSRIPTLDHILDGLEPAITAPVRVTSEQGRTFRYSGGGFCVLQRLVEIVTGNVFEDAARSLVLEPLDMQDSTFEQPLPKDLWSKAASAHLTLENTPTSGRWFVYPEKAVGGLWTSAWDLGQVVIEMIRASAGKGRVLSQSLYREMTTIHTDNHNSGLGTYISNADEPGAAYFSHLGAHLGWQAALMGYATLGKGAVVLTNNGYTGTELYREFLLSVAEEYEWPGFNGSFR